MIAGKTEYVISFASEVPDQGAPRIVVVERVKKDWQFGRLNLPGGHVEEGEAPEQAAVRELKEETGLVASLADTRILGTMSDHNWFVHVVLCPFRHHDASGVQVATQQEGEGPVHTIYWNLLKDDPRLIPNLQLIIPLCLARLTGWKLAPWGCDDHFWITTLNQVK